MGPFDGIGVTEWDGIFSLASVNIALENFHRWMKSKIEYIVELAAKTKIILQLGVQTLEIEVEGDDFVGMPFVLVSSGNWIKDNGSDFYVDISVRPKQVCGLWS